MSFSQIIKELRARHVPGLYLPQIEMRCGVVDRTRNFKWDVFGWFDTKTVTWGEWKPAPDSMRREALRKLYL